MVNDKNSSSPVLVANETLISRRVPQEGLAVSWYDWDFVKDRITRCRVRLDVWGHATAFFLGVIPLAITIWISDAISDVWSNAFLIIAIASLLLALACFLARYAIKRAQGESINTVLEDMRQIERRYQRPQSEGDD